MTPRRKSLSIMCYTCDISKNLVFDSLSRENVYKMIFESNKGVFFCLFKMNVMIVSQDLNNSNKVSSCAYLFLLIYMNFNILLRLKNLNLLSNLHIYPNHKGKHMC